MSSLLDIKYGVLTLTNIFSSVWLADWDQYEKILTEMPQELKAELPFHPYYVRDEVNLWQQNHFYIPGDHFISPYFSTYSSQLNGEKEEANKELLCLIGIYEKNGFYFPLENNIYPDHIGCLSTFVEYVLRTEIAAEKNQEDQNMKLLKALREEILHQYLLPLQSGIQKAALQKIQHPFLREFLSFYAEFMEKDAVLLNS